MTKNKYLYEVFVLIDKNTDRWKKVYSSVSRARSEAAFTCCKNLKIPTCLYVFNRYGNFYYHVLKKCGE